MPGWRNWRRPVFIDQDAAVDKVLPSVIQEAGRGSGARLLAFPEAFIPTYPYWSRYLPADLEPVRGTRKADKAGGSGSQPFHGPSEPGGPIDAGMYVIVGISERSAHSAAASLFSKAQPVYRTKWRTWAS